MSYNRTEIIELLRSTHRPGIDNVITWLDTEPSFFVASGARIHHDNVIGGLAYHSLKVYEVAKADWETKDAAFKTKYPLESIIISALLHDVCKKDVYYIDADGTPQWNEKNHRKGHGLRSVRLLEELGLELTHDERMAIWWHMGEGKEMSQPDYPNEYAIAMQDPFCQLIHQADHMAAKISDKEQKEKRVSGLNWDAHQALFRKKNEGRFAVKKVRIEIYKHNLVLFKAWKYIAPSGKTVDLPGTLHELLDATRVYREVVSAAEVPARYRTTKTDCVNEDCMVVAKNLIDQGLNPAILNMADAYHACGKYNSGDDSQESVLCRASTLSPTLYQYFNKEWAKKADVPLREPSAYPIDIRFSGIYSPNVTVFRDDEQTGFALREEPFQTAIISIGALNNEDETIMRDKIRTLYRMALLNGHDSLVLGPVSELFKETLEEKEFKGKFHTMTFTLPEGSDG